MFYLTVIALALVGAVSAGTTAPALFTTDKAVQKSMFEKFKNDYKVAYATPEEEMERFNVFVDNLKIWDERNIQEFINGGTAIHGVTKFADLSPEEFKAKYLRDAQIKPKYPPRTIIPKVEEKVEDESGFQTVAWCPLTPMCQSDVQDQGACSSAYAISASATMASEDWRLNSNATTFLSYQQILDCDHLDNHCEGGIPENAYHYTFNVGGLDDNYYYPYSQASYLNGTTGNCSVIADKQEIYASGYNAIASDENTMALYMLANGTFADCVNADSWQSYTSGILTVCGNNSDHCIQVTGVNRTNTNGWWWIKNSWGIDWGMTGFIYLSYKNNTCNIINNPTVPYIVDNY